MANHEDNKVKNK